jgi:hypothetical protein
MNISKEKYGFIKSYFSRFVLNYGVHIVKFTSTMTELYRHNRLKYWCLSFISKSFVYLIYGSTALVDLGCFFSFLNYTQPVGFLGRGTSLSQGHYARTEQHKHRINVRRHPCFEWDSNPRFQR